MRILAIIFSFCLLSISIYAQKYEVKPGDPNGIDKWYMGRQIARVMSHYGIGWLERPEREKQENTAQLIKNLDLKPGLIVADIGAGSGFHSSLISKQIGNGKIYAVDVEPEMLKYIDQRIEKENLRNITTVLGTEKDINLPANSIELMLLVDVYHEFSFPYEMAQSMYKALKPDGKLYIVEFRAEDPSVPVKAVHKMSEKQVIEELGVVGFKFERNISNLPRQHCMIFRKTN